jgi:hypothetical protein
MCTSSRLGGTKIVLSVLYRVHKCGGAWEVLLMLSRALEEVFKKTGKKFEKRLKVGYSI